MFQKEVGLARKMLTARLWAGRQGGILGLARTWVQILDLSAPGCGTLGESLHLSEPQSWSNTKEWVFPLPLGLVVGGLTWPVFPFLPNSNLGCREEGHIRFLLMNLV